MKRVGWIGFCTLIGLVLLARIDRHIALQFKDWMLPIFLVLLVGSQIYLYASGMMRDSMPVVGSIAAVIFYGVVIWIGELALFWALCFANSDGCKGL